MILYAESSAVLAWLLGEPTQDSILAELRSADRVVSCALTEVECARGVARARITGRISARDELAARRLLDMAALSWDVHDLSDDVMLRARGEFPMEPVRTLDALHLAAALVFRDVLGDVMLLSLDDRVRENARAMHFQVLPS